MQVAALCDIHGNLPAFEAVLDDVRREGAEQIVVGEMDSLHCKRGCSRRAMQQILQRIVQTILQRISLPSGALVAGAGP